MSPSPITAALLWAAIDAGAAVLIYGAWVEIRARPGARPERYADDEAAARRLRELAGRPRQMEMEVGV